MESVSLLYVVGFRAYGGTAVTLRNPSDRDKLSHRGNSIFLIYK